MLRAERIQAILDLIVSGRSDHFLWIPLHGGSDSPAQVAQLAAQLICNQQVRGSNPLLGSRPGIFGCSAGTGGGMAERLKAADCKSAALSATQVRILLPPPHLSVSLASPEPALARANRLRKPATLRKSNQDALIAQSAERVLGKNEVSSSNLDEGSILEQSARFEAVG